MGCDIHEYLEVRLHGQTRWQGRRCPPISRDYLLFGLLTAGQVRVGVTCPPAPEPRGLPGQMSAEVFAEATIPVLEHIDAEHKLEFEEREERMWDEDRDWHPNMPTTAATATNYLNAGTGWVRLTPDGDVQRRAYPSPWPGPGWAVEHPDWHSATYLTLEEMEGVLDSYEHWVIGGGEVQVPKAWFLDAFAPEPGSVKAQLHERFGAPLTFTLLSDGDEQLDGERARQQIMRHPWGDGWPDALADHWQSAAGAVARAVEAGEPVTFATVRVDDKPRPPAPDLSRVLRRMRTLAARDDVAEVRFVGWFDN